jgi:hypothetical protein
VKVKLFKVKDALDIPSGNLGGVHKKIGRFPANFSRFGKLFGDMQLELMELYCHKKIKRHQLRLG